MWKRTMIFLGLAALVLLQGCTSTKVYSVRTKPATPVRGGMLYALPRTQVKVDVVVEHRSLDNAPFAPFAQELLGLDSFSEDSAYSIRSIAVSGVNEADPRYYYFVRPGRLSLSVDDRHLLQAVGHLGTATTNGQQPRSKNYPEAAPLVAEYNLYDRADTFYVRGDKPGVPSKISTKPDSRSLRQRAIAAAEQIEALQDRRRQLLSGEYEGSYTPEALRYLQERLESQEQQLLQQFIGVPQVEQITYTYIPRDERKWIEDQTVALFAFSPVQGIVDTAQLHDSTAQVEVFYCNIRCDNTLRSVANFVKYRTRGMAKKDNAQLRKTFKYRQSERATVTIYGDNFSFSRDIRVSQFGPIVDLPRRNFKALFDPATGDLLYYQR